MAYLKGTRDQSDHTGSGMRRFFQGQQLNAAAGPVQAGKTVLMELSEVTEATADNTEKAAVGADGKPDKKPHLNFNFDFLQKLGKVLMTVIAVMPAAGLMISLGKLVQMAGADMSVLMTVGSTMENIGWAVINNLHILFAVAIGGSWAKERQAARSRQSSPLS